MNDTGFELVDMFLCCKFAEGDSRILQQKLTRDRLKRLRSMSGPDGLVATMTAFLNPFSPGEALSSNQLPSTGAHPLAL
jgi:hypothetical protein